MRRCVLGLGLLAVMASQAFGQYPVVGTPIIVQPAPIYVQPAPPLLQPPSVVVQPAPFTPAPPQPAAAPTDDRKEASESLQRLITRIVRNSVPHEYEDTKRWGKRKRIWNGVKFELDGLRIDSERRMKYVNHGTWEKYSIKLVDPENSFRVQIDNISAASGGRLAFDTSVEARLFLFGRVSQWERGVQLISLSADAEATVVLRTSFDVGLDWRFNHLPPDVLLDPVVREADVEVTDFRLRRISNARGPLIKQLGDGLHDVLEDKLREQRPRLVKDMNRQIDRNRDHLKLSVHDELVDLWDEFQERMRPTSAVDSSMK